MEIFLFCDYYLLTPSLSLSLFINFEMQKLNFKFDTHTHIQTHVWMMKNGTFAWIKKKEKVYSLGGLLFAFFPFFYLFINFCGEYLKFFFF